MCTLTDINECREDSNPCESFGEGAYCVNRLGSFACKCCAGYDLVDKETCVRNVESKLLLLLFLLLVL